MVEGREGAESPDCVSSGPASSNEHILVQQLVYHWNKPCRVHMKSLNTSPMISNLFIHRSPIIFSVLYTSPILLLHTAC